MNATTAVWPNNFYGKGGAPGSGALSFSDFFGRSGVPSGPSFTPAPGSYSANGATSASFSVSASENVVWNYTTSGGVVGSPASGSSVIAVTFTLSTTTNPKSGVATLSCTVGGITYNWNITLDVTGTA